MSNRTCHVRRRTQHQLPPIHGSISITQTLLAADLVDELRLVIAPTLVGSGQRLIDGLPPIRLETIRNTTTPGGHLLVDYGVTRSAKMQV
jgi:riboflavin biosynthesis pyrimidine reductase